MKHASEVYELLGTSAEKADRKSLSLLNSAINQDEIDDINWARAYALVELKKYDTALEIWQDIFNRTQDHKALHQVGFVVKSSGDLSKAADIFAREYNLISPDDYLAKAINLYEQSTCHLILGNHEEARNFFNDYERISFAEIDLIERGCFFRLKGDILKLNDINQAKIAYGESLNYFNQANDQIASTEIVERLNSL